MDFDLIIVGAGLVGASLASGLAGSGLRLALVDPEPPPVTPPKQWESRVYAISSGSRDFLTAIGAWARLPADRITSVDSMLVRGDARDAELVFSAYESDLEALCFIVESHAIESALRAESMTRDDVTVFCPSRPASLDFGPDSARLGLIDGRSLEARLIVGADGAQSWVRRESGIEVYERDYRQHALVANFEAQCAHSAVARQWFRRDGVLALLPLPGNRVSMVWSIWDAMAQRLLALNRQDLENEVQVACGHELGSMHLLSEPLAFPLRFIRVAELIRPRLALIGDAAHSIHPLAGQGVNLGFQDARELVHVLQARNAQDDCGDWRLLRRYARARKEAIAAMQITTDSLQRMFNNQTPGLAWLRNTGLALTDRVASVKKLLVEHALG